MGQIGALVYFLQGHIREASAFSNGGKNEKLVLQKVVCEVAACLRRDKNVLALLILFEQKSKLFFTLRGTFNVPVCPSLPIQ